jgi:gamma-glutamyltranspeptidase/glutathione hydrolase
VGAEEAVVAPRVHVEGQELDAEPGIDPAALDQLEGRGWTVRRWEERNLFFGGVQAVARNPSTGALSGAGDPRRGGAAAVVD